MAQATLLILSAFIASTLGAVCDYYPSTERITCSAAGVSRTCYSTTIGSKVASGYYYLGDVTASSNSIQFDMYRQKDDNSGFWDYNSPIPEQNCERRFKLERPYSIGSSDTSITVTHSDCWVYLRNIILSYAVIPFTVETCNGCANGACQSITTSQAPCSVDLIVH